MQAMDATKMSIWQEELARCEDLLAELFPEGELLEAWARSVERESWARRVWRRVVSLRPARGEGGR